MMAGMTTKRERIEALLDEYGEACRHIGQGEEGPGVRPENEARRDAARAAIVALIDPGVTDYTGLNPALIAPMTSDNGYVITSGDDDAN